MPSPVILVMMPVSVTVAMVVMKVMRVVMVLVLVAPPMAFTFGAHDVGNRNHWMVSVRIVVLAAMMPEALTNRGVVFPIETGFLVL